MHFKMQRRVVSNKKLINFRLYNSFTLDVLNYECEIITWEEQLSEYLENQLKNEFPSEVIAYANQKYQSQLEAKTKFYGGRLALYKSIRKIYPIDDFAILNYSTGALRLPMNVIGSISHKNRIAVAVSANQRHPCEQIGIDVEKLPNYSTFDVNSLTRYEKLALRILTHHEITQLEKYMDNLKYHSNSLNPTFISYHYCKQVLLRFSLKESLYKALFPLHQKLIPFKDVEVNITPQIVSTKDTFPNSLISMNKNISFSILFPLPFCNNAFHNNNTNKFNRISDADTINKPSITTCALDISGNGTFELFGECLDYQNGEDSYCITAVASRQVTSDK